MQLALQPAANSNGGNTPPVGTRLITTAELRLVDGMVIRLRRHWPLSFVRDCVARCRAAGKRYTLLIVGGEVKDPLAASHLAATERLIAILAAECASDPLCYGVHVALPPQGHSEELFWGKKMPRAAILAQKRLISYWHKLFPRQLKIMAGSAEDIDAMLELVDFGVSVCGGDRFAYKINSMSAKISLTWKGVGMLVEAAKMGAEIAHEALQPSNLKVFGGTFAQAKAKVASIEKMAGKKFAVECWYKGDLAKAGAK